MKLNRHFKLLVSLLFFSHQMFAQAPARMGSADIHDAIKKMSFLGSALYVAAHPDDENTQLISYLANDVKANVAYLSMTRGDGGQNLIGTEIRELLGLIRTQELLAARRIDGGQQMFSRANDFGFSKNPGETMEIWNKEAVLSDVVWAIRKWQPDIIVNRFQNEEDPNWNGRMHGHHTASAMLSLEAFDLAANKAIFPEQLKYVETWQPKRIFLNTSWFFYRSREEFEKADKSNMIKVDVGSYFPNKGISNTEISAMSRSMHKSQGFGVTGSRGSSIEYVSILKGDLPPVEGDLFSGINTTWTRVKGGEPIGKLLKNIENAFDYDDPSKSVQDLLAVRKMIAALPDGYWKNVKLKEVNGVIKACMGLFFEATASDFSASPGETLPINIEVTNRSRVPLILSSLQMLPEGADTSMNQPIGFNEKIQYKRNLQLPQNMNYSSPYWLNQKWEMGMYTVSDQLLRGLPETPRSVKVKGTFRVFDHELEFETDVVYKTNDRVKGEVYRPFEVLPPVTANIQEKVHLFFNENSKEIKVMVKAGKAEFLGKLALSLPQGWKTEPEAFDIHLKFKGEEQLFVFNLFPPSSQSEGEIKAVVTSDGKTYEKELILINYDHIPIQTVLFESQAKVAKINMKLAGEKIGYVMGAGDLIPEHLKQMGYHVTLLEDGAINAQNLSQFDAVVLGIRAYNTLDRIQFYQPELLKYVEGGGTMIVQYNTGDTKIPHNEIGPYPFNISRDRVTDENAAVRFLEPDHPVLNYPNKITTKDFEGWEQERGLYFPSEWDTHYQAIISCNDPNETPKDGGLIVAKYGSGHYIYTGYSWFRELPAGVAGAYRIFANMLALGHSEKP